MEQDSIQEWIEYHRSLGFEHFFIYGNDDDFRILAQALAPYIASRIVTYTHCPELGAQVKMYVHFLRWHVRSCEWVCLLDQDEYVRLTGFNDSVAQLTSSLPPEVDSVQLNWLNYGTSGFAERPSGSVLTQYTRRASALDLHTKHITRARVFLVPGALAGAFWHALPTTHARTCSALLDSISFWDYLADTPNRGPYMEYVATRSEQLINQACIAHYHLKSAADFKRRVQRGMAGQFDGQRKYQQLDENPTLKLEYMEQSNRVEDRYLADCWNAYVESLPLGNPPW